nr:MCE family protein [Amycolatopsis antarctica]
MIAVSAVAALALTGCGDFTGIYDIPLPGGADLGASPYTIKVQFRDVLDLVPQAGVKVNEVPVGRVDTIGLAQDGWTAEVTVLVNSDVQLPANALANLRQSSLLGEKYVELTPPAPDQSSGAVQGRLGEGALIPVERTNRNVEVEEVLGALSMLLNGGGVEQLNTITKELNNATEGRTADIRGLLDNANALVTNLDQQSGDITRALDGLNRLSSTLNEQKDQLANAVDNLAPGLQVLESQRGQLVTMLQALRDLSGVAVDTVNKSQEDLVANLRSLLPTLQKLGEAGSDLPKALEILLTFPFSDAAVDGVKGDYFNLYANIDLNLGEVLANLGRSRQNPLDGLPIVGDLAQGQLPGGESTGQPTAPPLPLPGVTPEAPGAPAGTPAPSGGQAPRPQQTGAAGIFGVLSGGVG